MESNNEKNLLEVENLSVSFTQYSNGSERRTIEVIHDISLSVKSGEILAVIGASGSGKSLLAHAIMGILPFCSLDWRGSNSAGDGAAYAAGVVEVADGLYLVRGHDLNVLDGVGQVQRGVLAGAHTVIGDEL